MSSLRPLISVVAPAFNEEECIPELVDRLRRVFDSESCYEFEVLIIENGSTDSSWNLIREAAERDPRFNGIRMSRNFGADGALTAGMDHARGEAVVLMAADLQDPPELIPEFLRQWERGYENVYMIVESRKDSRLLRRVNSAIFYRLAARLTDRRFPRNASDFRLIDRKVNEAVKSMKERGRFLRGLFGWAGFSTKGVPHQRPARFSGESKATTKTVMDLAKKGILGHSYIPLRVIFAFGVGLSLISTLTFVTLAICWLLYGMPFAGYGSIVSLVLLVIGVLSLMLGVVAEYIGLIYEEVKQRPIYLVSEECDPKVESQEPLV